MTKAKTIETVRESYTLLNKINDLLKYGIINFIEKIKGRNTFINNIKKADYK